MLTVSANSTTRIADSAPWPSSAPMSSFDDHIPDNRDRNVTTRSQRAEDHDSDRFALQPSRLHDDTLDPAKPSFRETKRKAHNERKVKAWIRSTTPELDMISNFADLGGRGIEPAGRSTMTRANSTPLLVVSTVLSRAAPSVTNLSSGQTLTRGPRDEHSINDISETSSWPATGMAESDLVPRMPSRPDTSTDRPGTRLSPPSLSRPRTFSRGFSASDIHSARSGELEYLSSTPPTAGQNATPRKSRPSFSSAFTLPRSFTASTGTTVIQQQESLFQSLPIEERPEGTVIGRQPRKQPSLMKGLRGSLFGLLHIGEGEEGRMRRKESKADLCAEVLLDNATGRELSMDVRRKKSFVQGEIRQE